MSGNVQKSFETDIYIYKHTSVCRLEYSQVWLEPLDKKWKSLEQTSTCDSDTEQAKQPFGSSVEKINEGLS